MNCYLSKDDWHSYYKKSLDASKLFEMKKHLGFCPKCQKALTEIHDTAEFLANGRISPTPPASLKLNVMAAIDKNRYKENNASPSLSEGKAVGCTHPEGKPPNKDHPFRRYKKTQAYTEVFRQRDNLSHPFELRNWGLSMVAAGFLLFVFNLSSLTPHLIPNQASEFNLALCKQLELPFSKMNHLTHDVLIKIDDLSEYPLIWNKK